MSTQPNILLIIADSAQQSAYGCYGHPQVQTPTINGLARQGVLFNDGYTTAPICHPSRASILTGMYPVQHSIDNNIPWDTEPGNRDLAFLARFPSYIGMLSEAGYRTGYVGQRHLTQEAFHDVVPGSYTALRSAGISEKPRPDRPHNIFYGELEHSADKHRDYFSVTGTLQLMRQYAQLKQPWLIQCEFDGVHPPCTLPREYARLYPCDNVTMPGNFNDANQNKQAIHNLIRDSQRTLGHLGGEWDDSWRQLIAHYWGYVSMLDNFTGQILEQLKSLGLAQNTLVIYTSDHGELMGAHGAVTKYPMMYDEVLRVPLIASWPDGLPAGAVRSGFVSHIDIMPTILDAAGLATPDLPGRSWLPLARGETVSPRDHVFAQTDGYGSNCYSLRMMRTKRWKYVYSPYVAEELYDLEQDPFELVNLAESERSVCRQLREVLLNDMKQQKSS
jgi:arylsulfatase A-like enzyme